MCLPEVDVAPVARRCRHQGARLQVAALRRLRAAHGERAAEPCSGSAPAAAGAVPQVVHSKSHRAPPRRAAWSGATTKALASSTWRSSWAADLEHLVLTGDTPKGESDVDFVGICRVFSGPEPLRPLSLSYFILFYINHDIHEYTIIQ